MSALQRLKGAVQDADALRSALDDSRLAQREAQYRTVHLARELARTRDALAAHEDKTRMHVADLAAGLREVERGVLSRAKDLRREHRAMQALAQALDRHTQRGLHAVPSRVWQELVADVWKCLGAMARGIDGMGSVASGLALAGEQAARGLGSGQRPAAGDSGALATPAVGSERQLLEETMVRRGLRRGSALLWCASLGSPVPAPEWRGGRPRGRVPRAARSRERAGGPSPGGPTHGSRRAAGACVPRRRHAHTCAEQRLAAARGRGACAT